jgi:hypothetical protein
MPYSAELSRVNPTCIVFLIDQSSSMAEPFGIQPNRPKADGVADSINRLLQNLLLKSAKKDGIRDYFQVGGLGYGTRVGWALGGQLTGQKLVPFSTLANHPLRVEMRTRKTDDGVGGVLEQQFQEPIWFEPRAEGRTPMCAALTEATATVKEFLDQYPNCFPPIVIHITDGNATDGNPEMTAYALRRLASTDGNVLFFNAHLSSSKAPPIEYPAADSELSVPRARMLFRMSSVLPPKFQAAASSEGFAVGQTSRGFVFNADLASVISFLNIGTRVTQMVL